MTNEAQSIVDQVKSLADSPNLQEIDKGKSIVKILDNTDWSILEEAYDELLSIIFIMENNKVPTR